MTFNSICVLVSVTSNGTIELFYPRPFVTEIGENREIVEMYVGKLWKV